MTQRFHFGNIAKEILNSIFFLKNICTPVFIAALFITTKVGRQPKCASVAEWIKKPWSIYTVEYYLAVKKGGNLLLQQPIPGSNLSAHQ